MNQDEYHLKLLSVFHYVVGALLGLFSLFPVFHLIFGLFFIFAPEKFAGNQSPPPPFLGWFFVIFALVFITIGVSLALCVLASGRFLAQRKHHLFCLIVGGIECLFMPLGTVLGVFTLIVLMREPVKLLFAAKNSASSQC